MPYLSHNYRIETKPRMKTIAETGIFVIFSVIAVFFTLMTLGLVSAMAAQAAMI